MSKLSFLFLTKGNHNCITAWDLFFKNIPKNKYSIYCHPKTKPTQKLLYKNVIDNIVNTQWGDISLIKATLSLLYTSFQDNDNKYFILVSDSCIPIIDFNFLKDIITRENKTWITWKLNTNKLDRYHQLHKSFKKTLPSNNFYSQHQWMILRRDHVYEILNTNLTQVFKNVHAADEHYFVTILYLKNLLNYNECINHKTTYCDWSNTLSMHPSEFSDINTKLLDIAQKNKCFFLRKVRVNPTLCKYLFEIYSK